MSNDGNFADPKLRSLIPQLYDDRTPLARKSVGAEPNLALLLVRLTNRALSRKHIHHSGVKMPYIFVFIDVKTV
ncbi:MAG: hypothetical protein ACI9BW_000818 [Gammaproteobacteria bacterium]|jgi:hypothetical protein